MGLVATLFTEEALERLKHAIAQAERETSGEIRLFVENTCPEKEVLNRATQLFAELAMHKTQFRNGVLIYVSFQDHRLAILGDAGINQQVGPDFWTQIKDDLVASFKQDQAVEGLIKGIRTAGYSLQKHFPYEQKGAVNELANDVIVHDN